MVEYVKNNGKPSNSISAVYLRVMKGMQKRIKELEAENAKLRKQLKDLRK